MNGASGRARAMVLILTLLAAFALVVPAAMAQTATEEEAVVAPSFAFPITNAKVIDSIELGITIYVAVQLPGIETVWIAAPICQVKVGDLISVPEGKFFPEVFNTTLGITFKNFIIPTKLILNGQDQKVFAAHGLPQFCTISR